MIPFGLLCRNTKTMVKDIKLSEEKIRPIVLCIIGFYDILIVKAIVTSLINKRDL